MSTFKEANQIRLKLKIQLSVHAWYSSSRVVSDDDGYSVVVAVKQLDNKIRKVIPPVVDGISVRTEQE